MNKEEIRAMVREEINAAFEKINAAFQASEEAIGWRTYSEDDATSSAAYVVREAMRAALSSLEPEAPTEPVNPFAPQRTAQQWAEDIRTLIEQAQNDGHEVWFDSTDPDPNVCLRVGPDDTAPYIWGGPGE